MSFKREGDDMQLLNRLKLKRVGELLGEHVPEDEAKLLSNGRLTCLICSHRPIFDTINILVIHRKGKKHIAELHKYLEHKQKLKFREDKRIQLENLRKERELNKTILGPKVIESDRSKQSKKKIIDITSKNPVGVNPVPSASSQVRQYLKEISKKTPLSKVVYQQKESYPVSNATEITVSFKDSLQGKNKEFEQDNKTCEKNKKELESSLFKHLSGWKRDKFGNLVRDPEAEFESSEEETESLPKG